jgi:hypothetical protein
MPKAGGKWNTFFITAGGPRLFVNINGVRTVSITDHKFANNAPGGAIKWRKVQIRLL